MRGGCEIRSCDGSESLDDLLFYEYIGQPEEEYCDGEKCDDDP